MTHVMFVITSTGHLATLLQVHIIIIIIQEFESTVYNEFMFKWAKAPVLLIVCYRAYRVLYT